MFSKFLALGALAVVALAQPAAAAPFQGYPSKVYISQIAKNSRLPVSVVRRHIVDTLLRSKKFSRRQIELFVNENVRHSEGREIKKYLNSSESFRALVGLESLRDRDLYARLKNELKAPAIVRMTVPAFAKNWRDLSRFGNWRKAKDFEEIEGALPVREGTAQVIVRLWENSGFSSGELMIVPVRMTPSELRELKSVAAQVAADVNLTRPGVKQVELNWGPHATIEGEARPVLVVELDPIAATHMVYFRKLVKTLTSKREYARALERLENR